MNDDPSAGRGAVALLFLALPAAAQNFPPLTGRVVDQAKLLRPEQAVDLDSKLAALEAQSGRQFVIATVNSLDGQEIDEYAYLLGRHWKIGDEKRDDGAVMVVAPKERKVWIATGYGAGGYLTDAVTGRIVREAILPRFKAGDMGGGIIAGADRVIEVMKLPPEEAARQAQAGRRQGETARPVGRRHRAGDLHRHHLLHDHRRHQPRRRRPALQRRARAAGSIRWSCCGGSRR